MRTHLSYLNYLDSRCYFINIARIENLLIFIKGTKYNPPFISVGFDIYCKAASKFPFRL